jgi:PAS domain S-box-containing protein
MAQRSAWTRYGVALLSVMGANLLRYWLDPYLEQAGFALFFVAVVIAAWFGGLGPSLFALVLSLITSNWLFRRPLGQPEPAFRVLFGLSVFTFVGVVTALLSESLRAAQRRAQSQADEAVRRHEQLRTTLACIGDAVVVSDRDGRLTMMNRAAEALTGWAMTEAIGQLIETVLRVSDELTGQIIASPIAHVLRHGKTVNHVHHTILTAKDGQERPINECAAPIRDENGHVTGVVFIVRDVTEQRRTEQALREADRRKDEFLAILAHELRNPLAPISSAVEILQVRSDSPQTMARAKEVLDRQVHHLVRLVDDLLDVSRIMRGRIDLRNELVDVATIIQRAVETSQTFITTRQHELSISLPDEPLTLTADPIRLVQVVNNLLTNAAKYTEPGGCIWLSAEPSEDTVIIRVRDTGIGIPSEMLSLVFELFTQVDSSPSRSQGGLGIGLTLVKSLVELSGGTVEARSDGLGKGSEFVVRLPMDSRMSNVQTCLTGAATDLRDAVPRRIMVVDDNTDAAETLALLLRVTGHEVIVAQDGPSALEAAAVNDLDLIFLDIGMPHMDGFEVARRLRQSHRTANVVLVALTGWGLEEDRRRTRAAGFDYHLVKPISADTINQLLARQGVLSSSDAVA